MPLPKIAIIGAGPVGLMLARLLTVNDFSCTIFELDKSPGFRNQGGIVDIHKDSGQLAFKAAGLFEEFRNKAMKEAENLKVMLVDGSVLYDENETMASNDGTTNEAAEQRDKPEIDRGALRTMLLDSVGREKIRWGKKLVEVVPSPSADDIVRYDLHFTDGIEHGFDLVIGADGAWSKVRQLVTTERPVYSGVTMIHLIAYDVSTKHPWLDKFGGKGSMFMRDHNRMAMCQRNANDRMTVYSMVKEPEDWVGTCGIDWTKQSGLEQFANTYFSTESGAHADFRRLLSEEALDEIIPRPLYMLPIGHRWSHRRGVTLVGDSAHLKTPFRGLGVNCGLKDALDLSNALTQRKAGMEHADLTQLGSLLSEAIIEYEEAMFVRTRKTAEMSYASLVSSLGLNGTREFMGTLGYDLGKLPPLRTEA